MLEKYEHPLREREGRICYGERKKTAHRVKKKKSERIEYEKDK